jgi:hypothetical protein
MNFLHLHFYYRISSQLSAFSLRLSLGLRTFCLRFMKYVLLSFTPGDRGQSARCRLHLRVGSLSRESMLVSYCSSNSFTSKATRKTTRAKNCTGQEGSERGKSRSMIPFDPAATHDQWTCHHETSNATKTRHFSPTTFSNASSGAPRDLQDH